jgi:hypothetical protein
MYHQNCRPLYLWLEDCGVVKGTLGYLASRQMAWLAVYAEHSVRHLIGLGTEVIVNPDLGNIEAASVLQVLGPLLAVVKQVAELMPIQ